MPNVCLTMSPVSCQSLRIHCCQLLNLFKVFIQPIRISLPLKSDRRVARTFVEYIFAPSANYLAEPHQEKDSHPEMLARFCGGLFHPLIHTGCGAEFGLLGLAAEGKFIPT